QRSHVRAVQFRHRLWLQEEGVRMFAKIVCGAALVLALGFAATAAAQQTDDSVERELETYRSMMKVDPWSNPGMLDVDRGEALWKTPAGPKNVSLEGCDLGLGPGNVDGAFARLPRYFRPRGQSRRDHQSD